MINPEVHDAFWLMLALLNPFLVAVYLVDFIRELDRKTFSSVLMRGGIIAGAVFATFACTGELMLHVFSVRLAAFQVFGGLLFALTALRMIFGGAQALQALRGPPQYLAGMVAMPFLIGPATISASVIIGTQIGPIWSTGIIAVVMTMTVFTVIGIKFLFDRLQSADATLAERYVDIAGRVAAMVMGSIAVDMVTQGVKKLIAS